MYINWRVRVRFGYFVCTVVHARGEAAMGIAVLMVEQNARQALKVANWAYLLEVGHIVESGPAAEIAGKESVREVFLGGSA